MSDDIMEQLLKIQRGSGIKKKVEKKTSSSSVSPSSVSSSSVYNTSDIHRRLLEIQQSRQKESEKIMKEIDDTPFLENLICDDDMRDFIKIDFQKRELKKINKDLEGEQQDCPKGDKTTVQIDAPDDINNDKKEDENENKLNEEETTKIELLINQTYEMCKSFLFPLLALISSVSNEMG